MKEESVTLPKGKGTCRNEGPDSKTKNMIYKTMPIEKKS